jgi:hypothetical protein
MHSKFNAGTKTKKHSGLHSTFIGLSHAKSEFNAHLAKSAATAAANLLKAILLIHYSNVSPRLYHGLLIRGDSPNSHNLILNWYPPN